MRNLLTFPRSTAALAPSDPFVSMERDIENMFGDVWQGFGPGLGRGFGRGWRRGLPGLMGEAAALPRLDVKETAKSIEVSAELPGVDEKDVDVEVTGRMLTIRGEKRQETDKDEKGYHVTERNYGSFLRTVELPYEAEADKVEAAFRKGVLTITVPKPKEMLAGTKKVAVKAA